MSKDKKASEQLDEVEQNNVKPHHKYFEDQFDDEEILYVFRHHPVVMRKGLVLGMLGPLVGVLPAAIKPELGFGFFFGGLAAGLVLGALIMLPGWIGWYFSLYIMSDQRFIQIKQKGLFHRAVADIFLNQVQSINYEIAGLQETLLGFGTIRMQTYVGDLVIKDVHHPAVIQKKLATILRDAGIAGSSYPSQMSAQKNHEEAKESR